eukprot:1553949-Pyramimonas_sp.AAC.1
MRIPLGVRQEGEGRDGTCHRIALGTSDCHGHGPGSLRCGGALRNGAAAVSTTTRQRGSAQKAGLTYQELAEANGEQERMVRYTLPPGSASVLGSSPGFARYDESRRCS